MKTFTDLEQSKKLFEFLSHKNADLAYLAKDERGIEYFEDPSVIDGTLGETDVPCWSLAALLDMLKDNIKIEKTGFDQLDMFTYSIIGDGYDYKTYEHKELIDACYEMIVKLHEKNELVL